MSAATLSVVMPVYNEARGVADVIADIRRHVLDVVPGSELVVVDDRSTDDTASVLADAAAGEPRIRIVLADVNRGHGPTMRRAMDASTGEWILHVDSDGQLDVSEFPRLWSLREGHDLVLGIRARRHDPLHRLVLTRFTRALVSVLARRHVRDANVPFKLIRRTLFDHLAPSMPDEAFAPSILIAVGAVRAGARITDVEVTHLPRRYGHSTLRMRRLLHAIRLSTTQTITFCRSPIDRYEHG